MMTMTIMTYRQRSTSFVFPLYPRAAHQLIPALIRPVRHAMAPRGGHILADRKVEKTRWSMQRQAGAAVLDP